MISRRRAEFFAAVCVAVIVMCTAVVYGWEDFVIWEEYDEDQWYPDVYGDIVVWQQYVVLGEQESWDLYMADISDPGNIQVYVLDESTDDQQKPVIYDNVVAWEDHYWGDWDVYVADITDPAAPAAFDITPYAGSDQKGPAISGDVVVWDDDTFGDMDVYGTEIFDPNFLEFAVLVDLDNQRNPAIYRNTVVWEDDFLGGGMFDIFGGDVWRRGKTADFEVGAFDQEQGKPAVCGDFVVWQQDFGIADPDLDIWGADISDSENVKIFFVAVENFEQGQPDIDGHIVVWQDMRNGLDYDIWGYNLITGQEFQITDFDGDQMNPSIHGNTVVWEDDWDGVWRIYAMVLDGAEVADCTVKLAGDLDGNCKVTLEDFAIFAAEWLTCGLEPVEACGIL